MLVRSVNCAAKRFLLLLFVSNCYFCQLPLIYHSINTFVGQKKSSGFAGRHDSDDWDDDPKAADEIDDNEPKAKKRKDVVFQKATD